MSQIKRNVNILFIPLWYVLDSEWLHSPLTDSAAANCETVLTLGRQAYGMADEVVAHWN